MRWVLDPGVLISALIAPNGTCGALLIRWVDGRYELVVSPKLLEELEDVLLRPKFRRYVTTSDVRWFVHFLAAHAEVYAEDPPLLSGVTPDPDDDYLVGLARSTNSDALVSGDAELTGLNSPEPPVVTPATALDLLDAGPTASAAGESAAIEPPQWSEHLEDPTLPDESKWAGPASRAAHETPPAMGNTDRCDSCGMLLPPDFSNAKSRQACPRCGSTIRRYGRNVQENA